MDMDDLKNHAATMTGGVPGIDMVYTGVDGMLTDGVQGPEIKLVLYGLISVVLGFFAWRKSKAAETNSSGGSNMNTAIKSIVIGMCFLGLMGCASTAGTMLDGRFCTALTAADIPGEVDRILKMYPEGTDRKKIEDQLAMMRAAGATATVLCELGRAIQGAQPPAPPQ